MRNIKSLFLLKFMLILALCFGTSVCSAQPLIKQPPVSNSSIRSGEILEYSVKIKGIPAGDQTLQVKSKKLMSGHEVYHVRSESRVRKLFAVFYPFSNSSESFIQSKDLQPLHYTKRIKDGKYSGKIDIKFDWDNHVARIVKDQKKTEIHIPSDVQDELSMIYLLRTKELEVGQEYEFPVLTGNKTMETTVRVLRIERLNTILGSLDTIVVKSTPKDVTIWLTNDSARIPVKIEAATKIGKLVSKLKAVY